MERKLWVVENDWKGEWEAGTGGNRKEMARLCGDLNEASKDRGLGEHYRIRVYVPREGE